MHDVDPVDGEYEPIGQSVQSFTDVLPAKDVVPARQLAQTNASVKVADEAPARAYLPAGQFTGIEQSVLNLLPAGEVKPAGQLAQTVASVKVADEAPARAYLPAGHVRVPVHEAVIRPVVDP